MQGIPPRTIRRLVAALTVVVPALAYTSEGQARSTDTMHARTRTTWDSVYSADQAARGETTYAKTCSRCHAPSMSGKDEAPGLTGAAFMGGWNGLTLFELHDRVRTTMPTDTPGTYSRQEIADVIAYMLKFNQFPAGKTELPTTDEELKGITFISAKP